MTVGDLLADLYDAANATESAVIRARMLRHLNKAQNAILREPGLGRLRQTALPLTFASVASQAIYGLPASLARVIAITDHDTQRDLVPMTLDGLRASDPALTVSGTPYAFVPMGYGPLQAVPASTGLWAVSTSASDVDTVHVDGIRAGGLPTGDVSTLLAGITRVALGTITDYVDVQALSLAVPAIGVVSIYDASSGGTVLAQIPIGQTSPRYFRVQLYPTPTAAVTYYVDGELKIVALVDNQDEPMVPEEFHDVLAAYARMCEYEYKGDASRIVIAHREYQTGLSRIKFSVNSHPADSLVMGRPTSRRFSRYGAWAPATHW